MLIIEDLDGATYERARALMASEHAAARGLRPGLPVVFHSAGVCAAELRRLCDTGICGNRPASAPRTAPAAARTAHRSARRTGRRRPPEGTGRNLTYAPLAQQCQTG